MTGVAVNIFGTQRLFGGDLRALVDVAVAAEEAGIDQLVLPDHVLMGPRTDRYPFGRFPSGPDDDWPEPLTLLAAIASRTTDIRLATGVLIAPLRPAALLAKTAGTLDVLSGGRLDLGIGTGWQQEEYDAEGVPFAERGRRLDDLARACRALWTGTATTFSSDTVTFEEMWCRPAPVQPGGVPLWFGGPPNGRTGRRIAELGAGWLPIAETSCDDVRRGVEVIGAALAAAGRDRSSIGVRVTAPVVVDSGGAADIDATLEAAGPFVAAGATAVAFPLAALVRSVWEMDAVLQALVEGGTRW